MATIERIKSIQDTYSEAVITARAEFQRAKEVHNAPDADTIRLTALDALAEAWAVNFEALNGHRPTERQMLLGAMASIHRKGIRRQQWFLDELLRLRLLDPNRYPMMDAPAPFCQPCANGDSFTPAGIVYNICHACGDRHPICAHRGHFG